MQPKSEVNIKGLIITLVLAAAVAAVTSIRQTQGGDIYFDNANFFKDSGLAAAFSALVGFWARRIVVPGGQGFPGVSAVPDRDTDKKGELPRGNGANG